MAGTVYVFYKMHKDYLIKNSCLLRKDRIS